MRKFFAEVRSHIFCLTMGAAVGAAVTIPVFYLVTFLESL